MKIIFDLAVNSVLISIALSICLVTNKIIKTSNDSLHYGLQYAVEELECLESDKNKKEQFEEMRINCSGKEIIISKGSKNYILDFSYKD